MTVRILIGDARERLKELPDQSVHCCVTSPPYFGLRDYGCEGQMGLEATPDAFVAGMVELFREVRRVLRDDGTLWLNLGDSYSSGGNGGGPPGSKQATNPGAHLPPKTTPGYGPKQLIGIPWRAAFALQADGWWLRQDIIWSKPNPMPESVRDRCTKAHEYLFLLSKGPRYYFDAEAIAEPVTLSTVARLSQDVDAQLGSERVPGKTNGRMKAVGRIPTKETKLSGSYSEGAGRNDGGGHRSGGFPHAETRNRRSVWEVATQPFSEAHFATYPPALIEPCILAGCPERCCAKCGLSYKILPALGFACGCNAGTVPGTVLDPFGGAGTTGMVADRLGRDAILIELNPEYAALAERRIHSDAGMFAEVLAA